MQSKARQLATASPTSAGCSPSPTIRGTVTAQDGAALADAIVDIFDANHPGRLATKNYLTTDGGGHYVATGVAVCAVKVEFRNESDFTHAWLDEWWFGGFESGDATVVDLKSGETRTIDGRLPHQVTITGTTLDQYGHGAPMYMDVFSASDPTKSLGQGTRNGSDGTFTIVAWPTRVKIRFTDDDSDGVPTTCYDTIWYGGSADFAHASVIDLRNGMDLTGLKVTAHEKPCS
ncbi:MAG TPA: carboxypeptidase-like regulatory domain-containing protein [Actinomycetota bacterium]|nr:carboxypeptidase-like regulatory domain-containing protein [Actinomycetota bacterium]